MSFEVEPTWICTVPDCRTNALAVVREKLQNEGYLTISFDALALELSRGPQ